MTVEPKDARKGTVRITGHDIESAAKRGGFTAYTGGPGRDENTQSADGIMGAAGEKAVLEMFCTRGVAAVRYDDIREDGDHNPNHVDVLVFGPWHGEGYGKALAMLSGLRDRMRDTSAPYMSDAERAEMKACGGGDVLAAMDRLVAVGKRADTHLTPDDRSELKRLGAATLSVKTTRTKEFMLVRGGLSRAAMKYYVFNFPLGARPPPWIPNPVTGAMSRNPAGRILPASGEKYIVRDRYMEELLDHENVTRQGFRGNLTEADVDPAVWERIRPLDLAGAVALADEHADGTFCALVVKCFAAPQDRQRTAGEWEAFVAAWQTRDTLLKDGDFKEFSGVVGQGMECGACRPAGDLVARILSCGAVAASKTSRDADAHEMPPPIMRGGLPSLAALPPDRTETPASKLEALLDTLSASFATKAEGASWLDIAPGIDADMAPILDVAVKKMLLSPEARACVARARPGECIHDVEFALSACGISLYSELATASSVIPLRTKSAEPFADRDAAVCAARAVLDRWLAEGGMAAWALDAAVELGSSDRIRLERERTEQMSAMVAEARARRGLCDLPPPVVGPFHAPDPEPPPPETYLGGAVPSDEAAWERVNGAYRAAVANGAVPMLKALTKSMFDDRAIAGAVADGARFRQTCVKFGRDPAEELMTAIDFYGWNASPNGPDMDVGNFVYRQLVDVGSEWIRNGTVRTWAEEALGIGQGGFCGAPAVEKTVRR